MIPRVVLPKKKDGSPRLSVKAYALYKQMKGDQLTLPKTKELIDDIDGYKIFRKLDMFGNYWQMWLVESIPKKESILLQVGTVLVWSHAI